MKTAYFIIAGLALATAGAVFAADDQPAATSQQASPHQLTRAEVQAQVIKARRNGTLIETEADMDIAQTRNQRPR